jgi:D-glycero-D-manno-heptose 1,7-bisphosphate phosphatase
LGVARGAANGVSGRGPAALDRRPLAFTAPAAGAGGRRRAVFLDRDGVINATVRDPESGLAESPLDAEHVRLLPGAAAAARTLVAKGYSLVCVSNQPAAAKGKVTVEELLAVHGRVLELLAREGVSLDAWRLCPHHPEGVVAELAGPCGCRKPAAGMLLDAATTLALDLDACWMLGDADADVSAGQAAGCRTGLIAYPGSAHKRAGRADPELFAADLSDAVARLPGQRRP